MGDCPCCGCVAPKRTSTCHPTCPEYIEWKKQHNKYKNKVYNNRASDTFFTRYVRDRNSKHMREL